MEAVSPPLSEQGPRRDPPSHGETGPGAPAPYSLAWPLPGRRARRTPSGPGTPPAPATGIAGGARSSPEPPPAQGRRTSSSRATSCHRPSSPRPPPGSLCANPAVPGPRSPRVALPGPRPGGRHVAVPGARPARTLLVALTVAPRLLLQVGACRGCRRPGRPGAGGPAERAYDPQVASHPAEQASEPTAAGEIRAPVLLPAAWRRAAKALQAPGRGQGRGGAAGGRHPIGPRRGGGGAGAEPDPSGGPRAGPTPPQRAARAAIGAARSPAELPGRGGGDARRPASGGRSWGLRAAGSEAEPLSPGRPI